MNSILQHDFTFTRLFTFNTPLSLKNKKWNHPRGNMSRLIALIMIPSELMTSLSFLYLEILCNSTNWYMNVHRCGIQTSFSSVNSPNNTEEETKKYGIDSGHWSSCTTSSTAHGGIHIGGTVSTTTSSAPSPWDPTSLSTSSDFLFDDEDRCLTPQLENFTVSNVLFLVLCNCSLLFTSSSSYS